MDCLLLLLFDGIAFTFTVLLASKYKVNDLLFTHHRPQCQGRVHVLSYSGRMASRMAGTHNFMGSCSARNWGLTLSTFILIFYKYFYKYRIYISIILHSTYKKSYFLPKLVRLRKVSISKLRFESSLKKLRSQKFECLKGPFTAILLFSGENRK